MKLLLVFSVIVGFTNALGRTQSVAIKGVLRCHDKPATNVKVKLYDTDTLGIDDLMDSSRSDGQGNFRLSGHTSEFTDIDPKMNIYHDCDDGFKPCQRRISIYIPDSYISSGENPKREYDAGTIQLAGKFSGETRDCIN